jgi:CelD/BcsL family acetyltransferase involved in cellulose biosynthesis
MIVTTEAEQQTAPSSVAEIQRGGAEIVDRLADEWRELCPEGPGEQPFYRPEWVAAYARNCCPKNKFVLVTARSAGRLTAVLPLVEERSLFLSGLPIRQLRGASEQHSWRFDLAHAAGPEGDAAVGAIWKALRGLSGWDVIELPDVPEGGAAEQLLQAARLEGFPIGKSNYMFTPFIELTTTTPASQGSQFLPRSVNLQRSLRRILRKLRAQGNMALERYDKADPHLLQRFYDLERAGWKGQEGTAIASGTTTRAFFDELAEVAAKFGYLSLYFLEIDGRDVAAHFGLCYGGRYFMVKCAYDESYAPYAPGHLLVNLVLQDCAERGLTEFDFMAHADEWKCKWTSEFHSHALCFIFNDTLYGRLLRTAKFKLRPALKRVVRPGAPNEAAPGAVPAAEPRAKAQPADGEILTKAGTKTAVVKAERGGRELVDRLAPQWRELCDEGPSDQPFYRPEWIGAYLGAFAPRKKLLLVTVRIGGRLKAVLPLIEERALFAGIPVKMVRGAYSVHSCRFDIVRGAGPDGDAAVLAVWNFLKGKKDWDVLELQEVPEGGAAEKLIEAAKADGFITGRRESTCSAFIPLAPPGIGEEWWLKRTDAKFRANLRRRARKLTAEAPLVLRRFDTAEPEALQRFYDLEFRGWKGREGSAIACHENTRRFYDEIAGSAARFGYFSLYLLEWNGVLLAGHFGLTHQGRYCVPKLAYDETYQQHAPGHLMVSAVLRDCVERGFSEFDFLGGWAGWKEEWTKERRTLSYLYAFRASPLGRLLYSSKFNLRSALKAAIGRRD